MNIKQAKALANKFGFVLAHSRDNNEFRLSPQLKPPVWFDKHDKPLTKQRAESIAAYFDDVEDIEQVKDMHNRMKHEFAYKPVEQASDEFTEEALFGSKKKKNSLNQAMSTFLAGKKWKEPKWDTSKLQEKGVFTRVFAGKIARGATQPVLQWGVHGGKIAVKLEFDSEPKITGIASDKDPVKAYEGAMKACMHSIGKQSDDGGMSDDEHNSVLWGLEAIGFDRKKYMEGASDLFGNPEPLAQYIPALSVMALGVVVAAVGTAVNAKKSLGKYLKSRTFAKYAKIPTKAGETRELATANSSPVFMTFVGRKFSNVHIELSTTSQPQGGVRQRYIITVGGFDTVADVGEVGQQVAKAMKDFAKRVATRDEETAKTTKKPAKKKSAAKPSANSQKVKTDNQKLAAALGRKGFKKFNARTDGGKPVLGYHAEVDGVPVKIVWHSSGNSRKIGIDLNYVGGTLNFYSGSLLKAFDGVGRKVAERIEEIEEAGNPSKLDLDAIRSALAKLNPAFASHAPGFENSEHSTEKLSERGKRLLKSLTNSDGVKGRKHDRASYSAAVTLLFGKKDKDGNFVMKDGKPVHEGLVKKMSINELKTVLYQMDKKYFNSANGGKVWAHLKTKNDVAGEILRRMEGSLRWGGVGADVDHRYKTREQMWNTPDRDNYGPDSEGGPSQRWQYKHEKKAERVKEDERRADENYRQTYNDRHKPGKLKPGDTVEDKGLFGGKKIRVVSRMKEAIEEARAAAKPKAKKAPAKKATAKKPAKKAAPKKAAKKAPAKKKSPAKKATPKKAPAKKPAKKAAGGAGGGKAAMKTPKKPAEKKPHVKPWRDKVAKKIGELEKEKLAPVIEQDEVKAPVAETTATPKPEVKPAKVAAMRLVQHAAKLGVNPKVINEGFIGYMTPSLKEPMSMDASTRPRTEAVVNYFLFRLGKDTVMNAVEQFISKVNKTNLINYVEKSVGATREKASEDENVETAGKKTSRKRPHDWHSHIPNVKLFDLKHKGKNIFDEGVHNYAERASKGKYDAGTLEARVFNLGRATAEAIVASGVRMETLAFKHAIADMSENAAMLFAEHAFTTEQK